MSTRVLANEEERALERERVMAREGREEEGGYETMPSTEVVKNRRRNECVSSSARLASAVKTRGTPPERQEEGAGAPKSTATEVP